MTIERFETVLNTLKAASGTGQDIKLVAQRNDGEAIHFNEISVYAGEDEIVLVFEKEKEDIDYAKENN